MKDYCKANGIMIPDGDLEILKTMYNKKFDVKKSIQDQLRKVEWIQSKYPFQIDRINFELLDKGLMYVAGRDRNYRPVIVVRPGVLDIMPELPSNDKMMGCICMIMEYVIKFMHLQGQIENVIMVIDLLGKGLLSMPVGVFKSVMQTIQLNYKCKSRNLFILNAPAAFTAIWNTV